MAASLLTRAKRAFVSVLLATAARFGLDLGVNRDADEGSLAAAYRRVAKKAHPDKGGNTQAFQKLQAAREAWDAARQNSPAAGRPPTREHTDPDSEADPSQLDRGEFRVRGAVALLTSSGDRSRDLWRHFLGDVRKQLKTWSVWRWCATLEQSGAGNLHVHLVPQFRAVASSLLMLQLRSYRKHRRATKELL